MITSADLKSVIYKLVRDSGVTSITGGGVYIDVRPVNTTSNDIVISSLTVDNSIMNKSVILVQIYAKNILNNGTHYPNHHILNQATKHLLPLLKNRYLQDSKIYLDIEYQQDYKIDESQEFVSVIRLQTRVINN